MGDETSYAALQRRVKELADAHPLYVKRSEHLRSVGGAFDDVKRLEVY